MWSELDIKRFQIGASATKTLVGGNQTSNRLRYDWQGNLRIGFHLILESFRGGPK